MDNGNRQRHKTTDKLFRNVTLVKADLIDKPRRKGAVFGLVLTLSLIHI